MPDKEEDVPKPAVGFKIAGKARPKVAVNIEERQDNRQLITGVSDSGVLQAAGPAVGHKQEFVIPKLQNTYKAGVGKFVPSFVPESTTAAISGKAEDRYERAAAPDQPSITNFGLEVRKRKADAQAANAPATGRFQVPGSRQQEADQLREDLEQLPAEATVEDYEALPVEEFGKALLRGFGWSEGQGVGVGDRKRQKVEPKQLVRRPDRLGLGANPAAPPPDRRPRKMGDKPKQDLVAAPAVDGTVRHRIGLDEKLVPRSALQAGPVAGKVMKVVGGRHQGLMCVVKEVLPAQEGASGCVLVELQPSSEVVKVSASDLAERGSSKSAADNSRDRQNGQQQLQASRVGSKDSSSENRSTRDPGPQGQSERGRNGQQQRHSSSSRRRSRSRSRSRSRNRTKDGQDDRYSREGELNDRDSREQGHGSSRHSTGSQEDYNQQQQRQRQQPAFVPRHKLWVAPLIRVRVVDKRLQGGKLYLKKGTVLDVAPDGVCDVRMEESKHVVNAHQDQLETVVPKDAGAAVMVVQGDHKGRKGRLLQVSLNSGAAALQLVGDMAVERMLLDHIAQYVGHLEEEQD